MGHKNEECVLPWDLKRFCCQCEVDIMKSPSSFLDCVPVVFSPDVNRGDGYLALVLYLLLYLYLPDVY